MMGTNLFHLYLHITLCRIHIIKLFLAALACIILIYRVHIFLMVIYLAQTLHCQTQLIKSCIFEFIEFHSDILLQRIDPKKYYRTKIKVITQAAGLPVYSWGINYIAIYLFTIM